MTEDTLRHDSTYRRGVILGLTMAEIMVLVVFCLMALMAVVLEQMAKLEGGQNSLAIKVLEKVQGQYSDPLLKYDDFAERLTDDWEKAKKYESLAQRLGNLPPEKLEELVDAAAELYSRTTEEQRRDLVAFVKTLPFESLEKDQGLPPLIDLRDKDNKFFEVGSARVSDEFRAHLKGQVADKIWENLQQYPVVDVIEIVGHTSETSVGGGRSSLDQTALAVVRGTADVSSMSAGDNAGLGLARAIAVMMVLKEDPRLKDVTMLPLSAGPMIQPVDVLADGSMSGEVAERRRIEIRARRKLDTLKGQE